MLFCEFENHSSIQFYFYFKYVQIRETEGGVGSHNCFYSMDRR